ncbi:MAG: MaoC family dehydratase N-terminal domain-containing protein [Actinobacteria bacterium]|nr:MaoC family dehydratase N-terminal domain-containing protein [Actinomycetota bacterium]
MSLNRATVGRAYDPGPPFDVSRQKIREFAAAIGDDAAIYADPELARSLGHRDVPAPPTFGSVISLQMGQGPRRDPELGLDYARVVHGEQRIEQARPIYAGDSLLGEVTIASIRDAGANELLEILCALSTEAGEPVCRVTSVLVSRGTAAGTADG